MSKTSRELIEFCKGKLGTPYVFGMKGQVLTEALLKQLAAENPKVYTPQYINLRPGVLWESTVQIVPA